MSGVAEFPVVGVQLVVKMSEASREEDVRAVMSSFHQIEQAIYFTAAAILPIGIDCRIEVVEL